MNSFVFVAFSIFVGAQSQIFAPTFQRTGPAMMPGCPCGNPAPLPVIRAPYEIPLALPVPAPMPRAVAKAPCGCEAALPAGLPFANPFLPAAMPAGLPLANPFLPAASPVSAMAPFSPLLPPANTCSRCQYLKKIPIPPPCI